MHTERSFDATFPPVAAAVVEIVVSTPVDMFIDAHRDTSMKVIDADRYRSIDGHRSMNIDTHRGAINIASKRPGCEARVTEKAIHASIGMAVMD